MPITWTDYLAIDVEEIDNQHRELFRRINELLQACDEGRGKEELLSMLQFLDDYAREHFRAEEKFQEEIGFPDLARHRELHRDFVREIQEIKKRYVLEGTTQRLVSSTNRVLVGWLIQHVSSMDREIGKHARKKESEKTP